MQKIKILTGLLVYCITNLLLVKPAMAITPTVSIQGLPGYVNTNDFKLSCSALGGSNVQFSFKKEGGSYQNFGSSIDITSNPCQIQVTGSQVSEEAKFYFKVTLDGGISDETSVIFDNSGPSQVSNYYRDVLGTETVLHWRNPNNTDFDSVFIYRGETVDFSADSSHEIARVSGSPDSDMTYGNHTPSDKTYYYSIRAIDRAGNSSGLVGDGSISTTSSTVLTQTQPKNASGSVKQLPKEASGQVLGEENNETEKPEFSKKTSLAEVVSKLTSNKKWIYAGVGSVVAIMLVYYFFKRKLK